MQPQPIFAPSPPFHRNVPKSISDPLEDLRRELVDWAEPVIADRILDGYREQSLDTARIRFLSGQHRRLWRAIILEHRGLVSTLRSELHDDLSRAGVEVDVAGAIDQSVIEELIDIVLRRFRASRERAKGFSMVLLSAASHLGTSGVAA